MISLVFFGIFLLLIFKIMEHSKASAKDFFLHLGAIVALYTVTVSFVNLVFKIINRAFPQVGANIYAWGSGSEISLPVATLIIFFPLFILLSYLVYRVYEQNPDKKEMLVRKWLIYITLFIAGLILAIDLVTVLYKFLDGQDLSAAFWLKALAVLLVAASVFGYYIQDIRNRVSPRGRKIWVLATSCLLLATIIIAFSIIGSPQTQRLIRLDNQKISDLQNLNWQVINYWQINGMIPDQMPGITKDQQTGTPYQYKKTGNMTYELCAVFNRASSADQNSSVPSIAYPVGKMPTNEDWSHSAGLQCFSRTIDPVAYPTQVKG